jgi:RNA polymerase sigma factor (sigma-70 family)
MGFVSRGAKSDEGNDAEYRSGHGSEYQRRYNAGRSGPRVRQRWGCVMERSNEQWLAALRGPSKDEALADLRVLLVRGLRAALHGQTSSASVEDFVQEALIKILDNLHSFRGESRFSTWAQKICVRTAFAETRRRRWSDVSLEEAILQQGESMPVDSLADPEQVATRGMMLQEFRRFIDEELTDRQRTALLAGLGGMPLEAVADRMATNRNALYKLLHDARKRLKRRMVAENLLPQDMFSAFEG